jgi:hypothetical protein
MGDEIAVKVADYQDEGRFSAYVSKTFYRMNHLFRHNR